MSKFDTLYSDVKRFYNDSLNGQLTVASVTTLTRYSMELVQTQNLKGSEKKAMVEHLVNELVKDALEESDIPQETQDAIQTALILVPLLVDAAVDFAKIYSGSSSGSGCKLCCIQ